jgi:arylamine N-acetyltransferase
MENDNCVEEYLKRIGVNQPTNGPDEEYLIQLQMGHLTHIPFETFDLIDLKQLDISPDYIFDRLVNQRRGGVCFQINGLFEMILKKFNYNVQMIPCSAYGVDINDYLANYSHVSLCVTLNNGTKFLCDVGFSRDFLTPLFFRTDCIQFAINGFFRLTKTEDGLYYKLERGFLNEDDNILLPTSSSPQTHIIDINPERIKWMASYRFSIDFSERSTKLEDFRDICPYILHSPEVRLNRYTICRINTYKPSIGAYGIIGKEYWEWIIENGIEIRKHHLIADDNELKKLLKEKFNLIIERKIELADRSA